MTNLMKLTTGYLLVCPLLGALVLGWALDPASGLAGMMALATYTILHVTTVLHNSYLHWDRGLADGVRVYTSPTVVPWTPPDTGVEE